MREAGRINGMVAANEKSVASGVSAGSDTAGTARPTDFEPTPAGGRLTDSAVRKLPAPASGNRITYDRGPGAIRGFGIRVTTQDARAFALNYTLSGRERRLTIGAYPAWTVAAAREEAKRLKRDIDRGCDPLSERIAAREAPTMDELCDRFLDEHAAQKRPPSEAEYRRIVNRLVRPELGARKVAEITYADIDRLHRKLTTTSRRNKKTGGAPYAANRLVAMLSKMFSLAVRWGMRANNPAKGVERTPEQPRRRYLSGDELRRLTAALAAHPSRQAADAIRLLLLTGARSAEVLNAPWEQFDRELRTWSKPGAHTKQKRPHPVPLSAPARRLLVEMRTRQEKSGMPSPWLFPGRTGEGPMVDLKTSWRSICRAGDLRGLRLHDLRHSFASILASAGLSLPVIGALLGHSNPTTTARYVHLFDDPLRAAAERVGAVVTTATADEAVADVVTLGPRRSTR
jgi:integrase